MNGIVASIRTLLSLTPIIYFFIRCLSISYLLLAENYKLNSLLTPTFYKIQSFIFRCLEYRDNLPCPCTVCFPCSRCLRDQPKECLCVRRGAGIIVYPSLSVTFLKLFLYTQSVVRVLYLVRILYSIQSYTQSSPNFIPSLCFISCLQSVVRSPQSAVHSPQSTVYTDRFVASRRSRVRALISNLKKERD